MFIGYTATNLQTGKFPFGLEEWGNALFGMSGEDGALSQIEG